MPVDEDQRKDVMTFWNNRANLGLAAGSKDLIAKQLEMTAIAGYVRDGMRILDAGCGNGVTAIEIARDHDAEILGLDYAPKMIEAAQRSARKETLRGTVTFKVGDIRNLPDDLGLFDLVYTERVLINLPDWSAQQDTLRELARLLNAGARYVMCENSQNGLDQINRLRQQIGLPQITTPWHNRYLVDEEVESLVMDDLKLEEKQAFSSTYYFLSRIVNAWMAQQERREPAYDAPVNRLALKLPAVGDTAQVKIWVWRKTRCNRFGCRILDTPSGCKGQVSDWIRDPQWEASRGL